MPKTLDYSSNTQFLHALKRKSFTRSLEFVLQGKINPNCIDDTGVSALTYALYAPTYTLALRLIEMGADETFRYPVQEKDGGGQGSLLVLAIKQKNAVVASRMLKNPSVDINYTHNNGLDAARQCIISGQENILKDLITKNVILKPECYIDAMNSWQWPCFNLLLKAKLHYPVNKDGTLLHAIARRPEYILAMGDCIKLLAPQLTSDILDSNGHTPLSLALEGKVDKIIRDLLLCGANVFALCNGKSLYEPTMQALERMQKYSYISKPEIAEIERLIDVQKTRYELETSIAVKPTAESHISGLNSRANKAKV